MFAAGSKSSCGWLRDLASAVSGLSAKVKTARRNTSSPGARPPWSSAAGIGQIRLDITRGVHNLRTARTFQLVASHDVAATWFVCRRLRPTRMATWALLETRSESRGRYKFIEPLKDTLFPATFEYTTVRVVSDHDDTGSIRRPHRKASTRTI